MLRIKIGGNRNSSLKKDWVDQRERPISDQKERKKMLRKGGLSFCTLGGGRVDQTLGLVR